MAALRAAAGALILAVGLGSPVATANGLLDARADPYFAVPALRALMDWVTFRVTFDGESMRPDMAGGSFEPTVQGTPQFRPGLKGQALLTGPGSGLAIYPRKGNAQLATRGAISLWVCPLEWTRVNGGNTELVMTTNASFYIQRQGPMHDPTGVLLRQEGVQLLMLSETTGNHCLMFGTESWPNGQWRLLVANWSWPSLSFSLDGGEFQSLSVKSNPTEADFGDLVIGSMGGEPALLDEVTIYRRPLTLQEARSIHEILRPR